MRPTTLLFDELAPHVATKAVTESDESRVEPIINPEDGREEGVLVQSSLERVAVFVRKQAELTLADVTHLRRAMRRVQARRSLLCVPTSMTIPNPVLLLATLSKIEVIRLGPAEPTR